MRGLVLVIFLQACAAFGAEPQQVQTEGARFLGAISCKSSSCHGGAGEKRSQYFTWLQKDFHTRGFAILTNARSARIAETLHLDSATTSNRCTSCHSPMEAMPPSRLTSGVDPHESVSCESCHGAAEPWLRGHTRPDWTYATRVGAGMRDLKSFYVRANTCVACHQNLDAAVVAAGHPELVFELDRQSIDEPEHWRDPDETGVRAWLVGQAVALRELSWHLSQNSDANEPARLQWQALVWLLRNLPEAPAFSEEDYSATQRAADALARRAAQRNFKRGFSQRLTSDLAALQLPMGTSERAFRCAQRLLLALECSTRTDAEVSKRLKPLRDTVRSPAEFDPAAFSAQLAEFRRGLTSR